MTISAHIHACRREINDCRRDLVFLAMGAGDAQVADKIAQAFRYRAFYAEGRA